MREQTEMSGEPKDFLGFKRLVQDVLDGNEQGLEALGKNVEVQLKTYLLESSVDPSHALPKLGAYRSLDATGWYAVDHPGIDGMLVLDATQPRVWRLFSLIGATTSDDLVERWIMGVGGLDRCWLSRRQLMRWEGQAGWSQRGLGLYFNDGLASEEEAGNFSLKAWHGARNLLRGLNDVINTAKDSFAISSVRWQHSRGGQTALVAECYSNGKITVNRATDVDEALSFSTALASRYQESIEEAGVIRDRTLAPFEFQFSQKLNLDAFSDAVARGRSPMRLWLTEVESDPDFRRFKGVDMHTWDRISLDLGTNYGFLTIPSKGCVNAAPRIATIQGEDNSGRTSVFFDGVELFA